MSKHRQRLKVIATADLLAMGSMHMINQMVSASAVLKNILKPGVGSYYHWKTGDVFFRAEGNGAPLLLIHDLTTASSSYEWSELEEKLKADYTVYTLDLPGCGRSDKPGITYTNYLYVQLVNDFIRDIIGEAASVAVTGLSSSFVIMAAYQDPSLFRQLMLINPVSLARLDHIPNRKSKIIRSIMEIPIIGTTIYYIKSCHQNIEYNLTEKYVFNPFRIPQRHIDAYYEAAHRKAGGGKYLQASLDGFYLNVNLRRVLPSLKVPVSIIYGEKTETGKEIAECYRRLNPAFHVTSIYGTKLLPQLETPEEMLTQIQKYLPRRQL